MAQLVSPMRESCFERDFETRGPASAQYQGAGNEAITKNRSIFVTRHLLRYMLFDHCDGAE
jgi:hypothetical protein